MAKLKVKVANPQAGVVLVPLLSALRMRDLAVVHFIQVQIPFINSTGYEEVIFEEFRREA